MHIIIAPAKKMVVDTDSFAVENLPQFLEQTERLEHMGLRRNLTSAVIAYEGIQYRYMAPGVMETVHLDYLREHLCILSGFYGLLRSFDGVTPYRLEMQARLSVDRCQNLYQFWGDRLARQLTSETDLVLNLASKEYINATEFHLPGNVRFLNTTRPEHILAQAWWCYRKESMYE